MLFINTAHEYSDSIAYVFKRFNCEKHKTYIWSISIDMEKRNIDPIPKNSEKKFVESYKPVSLCYSCGKILEKLILNEIFQFYNQNIAMAESQSNFKPWDSSINHFMSITLEIEQSFDIDCEVKGIYFDIFITFD